MRPLSAMLIFHFTYIIAGIIFDHAPNYQVVMKIDRYPRVTAARVNFFAILIKKYPDLLNPLQGY